MRRGSRCNVCFREERSEKSSWAGDLRDSSIFNCYVLTMGVIPIVFSA